jgi:hypothetical protein
VSKLREQGLPLTGGDLALAIPLGLLGALLVTKIPWELGVVAAMGLAGLALATRFQHVERAARVMILLSAFLVPMNRLGIGIAGIRFGDVTLSLALGLYLLIHLRETTEPGDGSWRIVFLGIGLLLAGGIVGMLFETGGPFIYQALGLPPRDISGLGENLGNLFNLASGSLVPLGALALCKPNRAFVRKILGWFVAGCTTSAVVGGALPFGRGGQRIIGLTVHPNPYGSLSLLAMGPAIGLMLRSKKIPAWGYFVLPVLAFAVLQSGSRAALGALFVFALLIGPLTGRKVVMGALLGMAAVALILFATGIVRPEGENALGRAFGGSVHAANSDSIREDLGHRVWARFAARPITGNGYNYMRPSHDVYLGLIASAGVLGVLGLGTIITTAVRRTWRKREDLLAVCVSAGYFAYLANAAFDNVFWWRWLWFYVGLVFVTMTTKPNAREMGLPEGEGDAEGDADPGQRGLTASTR